MCPVSNNIHVLHIVPTLGAGGMELALSRVVRGLIDQGMLHSIVCLKGHALIQGHFDESVQIYCMNSSANDVRLPWRLWQLIRSVKPTVIHARNWSAWPDVALARLFTFPRTPLVFSFHGLDSDGPMPLRRRIAFRVLARMTTHIFTVSKASRQTLAETVDLPARRIGLIPNGVDIDRFRPMPIESPYTRSIMVGTVGSLAPVKNQALLIRSCAHLIAEGINLELHIAGEGPQRPKLTETVKSLNVSDRVHLRGYVDDVPRFLQGLDIFVLSSNSEAHPNALLEAMACGLACVATRVGGVNEILDSGKVGLIVNPGDEASLSRAIAELAASQGTRHSLGRAARDRVCREYNNQQMIKAYAELYGQISNRH